MKLRKTYKKETSDSEQSSDSSEHSLIKKENSSTSKLSDNSTKHNKRPGSPIEDDSLADFKLPKLNSRSNQVRNGVKLLDNAKKSTKLKSNSSRNVKQKTESNQMSIESSFFKLPTAFVCPLCLKSFNESNQQIVHSKNCAIKNQISTRQLIAATELHERQTEERKAIGLPAAPLQQHQVKKTPKFKRTSTNNDPDVELAIALSKSLSEAQEMEDLEEAVVLAAESNEKILEMSSSQRKSTLINFGFITNKPIVSDFTEKSKKKKTGSTILQTRTEEVRSRLLAERIAEVIVDNVLATQRPVSPDSMNKNNENKNINFKSMILKEIYVPDCKLWNRSAGKENVELYYIETLWKFIRPIQIFDKLESKDKLHSNETMDDKENEIGNIIRKDCMSPIHENISKIVDIQGKQDLTINLMNNDENAIKNEEKRENISRKSEDKGTRDEHRNEQNFKENRFDGANFLALSWGKMINSKVHSDVIIYVKHKQFIFSHFLVLWTRCREIEKDIIPNNDHHTESEHHIDSSEKKLQWKIMWENIEYEAGIIFIEFIYCGYIMNLEALKDKLILNDVKNLSHKYNMEELNFLLRELEIRFENLNTECLMMENNEEKNTEKSLIEQNEDNLLEYSIPNRYEARSFDIKEDKNEVLKTDESLNTDSLFQLSEFSTRVKDDKDINSPDKDNNSVNKIIVNKSCTENPESTIIIISEDELELSAIPKSAIKTHKNELLRASFMSASPDIFDGMETMNLGNSFGKKHQNVKDNKNCSIENFLQNDHKLPISIELCNKNEGEIIMNEKNITTGKSVQIDQKYFDDFTQTVEEHSRKEEQNIETSCSKNDETLEMTNQLTKTDNEYEKLSKNISATRNNLSLFIEKIQRRNARFLESDTDEDDSIVLNQPKKKNPFKIGRLSDNDSGLLNKLRQKNLIGPEEENLESDLQIEKKSALSFFEDDVRKRVASEMKKKAENDVNIFKDTQNNILKENTQECNSDIEFVDEHWSDIENYVSLKDDLQQKEEKNKLEMNQKRTKAFDKIAVNELNDHSEETNSDEANESMYTKYKKTHRRNSIDKYRAALKSYFHENPKKLTTNSTENDDKSSEDSSEHVKDTEESQRSSEESYKKAKSPIQDNIEREEKTNEGLRNKRISLINQKNLTELSSFDFYEIEDIPEEGRIDDDKNSTQNSPEAFSYSIDLTITSDEENGPKIHKKINEDVLSCKQSSIEKRSIVNREMYEDNSNSTNWDDAIEINYLSNQNDSTNKSREQPDNNDFSLIVESNWEPHPPKIDWKNERSNNDSFTQFTGTPTVTENVTKLLQECGVLSFPYQNKDKSRISIADILSPIVLSSASDSDGEKNIDEISENLFLDFGNETKDNFNGNKNQINEDMNFTQFEYEGGANTDFAELSDLRLSTPLPITSSTQYLKTPSNNSRLSQMSERVKHDVNFDKEEEKLTETKNSRSRRCSSISPLKNESQRLLQVKSQSEGNFSNSRRSLKVVQIDEKIEHSKRKQGNRKNEKICEFLGLSPLKVDISFNVSPKESYNQLSSPELKKRLASFGLKNQERHRAVRLLNFIWDQMHPLVPENLIPNDVNKHYSNTDTKKNNSKNNLLNDFSHIDEKDSSEDDSERKAVNRSYRTGFPEEFEFSDDGDDNDNSRNDKNHLNKQLQQNFERLLEKDHILHRKVLMYEPISLDIFAEKLKEFGFQVKPKILADFLNSECISFFIEAPKKWSGNIRKNKKK